MKKIGILNLGINNIKSITNACKLISQTYLINSYKDYDKLTEILVLPGNGNFATGMKIIEELGFRDLISEFINSKKKFIGICLGLQLLMEKSDEAKNVKGLSLIKGTVKKIDSKKFKVPLLGWYDVKFKNENINSRGFFFNNGFMVDPVEKEFIQGEIENIIPAYVVKDNICGFQFHPEKSSFHGLDLLKNVIFK